MSPSSTPATQSAAASRATKAGPSAPPSAMSATPATQNVAGCEMVPRLPRETNVDVTKRHACHAKCRGVTRDQSGHKRATQCHECHACHAKRRWMTPLPSVCITPLPSYISIECRNRRGEQVVKPGHGKRCQEGLYIISFD